ncbi:hypothetical protein [Treponema parvum]|uniref:hypothetical protein n=1 Tax=Treponema parvum TaxID=138851 RepID=UPI00211E08DE|nr:hypothetical protein [Treponema parvum]
MKTKQKLTEETAKRYCTASKSTRRRKSSGGFITTTGYNRSMPSVLKNTAYIKITHFNNVEKKSVQVISLQYAKSGAEKYYCQDVQQEVIRLWLSMYAVQNAFVPFIRDNIDLAHPKGRLADENNSSLN